MELEVPSDLYGLTIVEPTMLDRKLDGTAMFLVEVGRIYGMLAANYFLVILFMTQLWKMVRESKVSECSGELLGLELGCVFIFEVRMLTDLRKGLSIATTLWSLHTRPSIERSASYKNITGSSPSAGAVLVKEDTGVMGKFRSLGKSSKNDPSKQWKLTEVSRSYRIVCALVIALPKLALDMALAYLGGVYVMRSESNSDMVLNTLAVVFVAEIPELMYTAFTSEAMRYSLEGLTCLEIELTNRQRLLGWFAGCVLAPLFTVVASWMVVDQTRASDCPDGGLSFKLFWNAWHTVRHDA
mmetsp:Transcript_91759/g.256416  ORF Transcript_91759/g.256416 Transcript_91759/m.256416 type:complete len:298 (-) Transcript_91759:278-1171(-)